jgi:hypothetical protein
MGTTAMTKSPTLRNMAVFPRHSFHHASSLILVNCLLRYAEKTDKWGYIIHEESLMISRGTIPNLHPVAIHLFG